MIKNDIDKQIKIFLKEANEVFGNRYVYSIKHVKDNLFTIEVICPKHGAFYTTAAEHFKSNTGCSKCDLNSKNTFIGYKEHGAHTASLDKRKLHFLSVANSKYGEKFKYYMEDYVNRHRLMRIECPDHGLYLITPYKHIRSTLGCFKCSGYDRIYSTYNGGSQGLTLDTIFKYKANKKFNGKFNYDKVEYINSITEITIICPSHGEFRTTPISHFNSKYGCPYCASETGRLWRLRNCSKYK